MAGSPELIIFDLDGTLVDSRHDVAIAINHGLVSVGAGELPIEEIFHYIGKPLDFIFADILKNDDPKMTERACDSYREFFFDNCANKSALYPGVMKTVKELCLSHTLAIATTKQTFMAVRVGELLGFDKYFKCIQGTDGFKAKPDPTIINMLLAKFDINAEKAIMVGDTTSDIMAGKNAGVKTCAVNYGIGKKQKLDECRPDFMVDSFSEILAIVKEHER